jgi:hypothetical protein
MGTCNPILRLSASAEPVQRSIERRKHTRFEVSIGLFVVLGPHSAKVGRVIDVSRKGLSFRHVDRKLVTDGLCELDILDVDDGFCVKKAPFEIVWGSEGRKTLPTFLRRRQSGVRFVKLTSNQKSKLEYLIQNYTQANAEAAFIAGVKTKQEPA